MPQHVKLGLIGVGNILPSHRQSLAQLPEFEVVSVCDTDPERRRRVADELDAASFADYREQLAAGPDAVLVALPHGLHCAVTVAALEAGCHALVEKPMAVGAAECRHMLEIAARCDRALVVSEATGMQPGPVRTGEWFSRGDLGRFFTGSIVNERFYFNEDRPAWFLDPAMSGGGMFSNVGLHRLAVSRACLPGLTPITVSATVSHQAEWRVEACTSALVRYAEGGSVLYEEVGYYPKPEWLNTGTHYVFEEGIVSWDDDSWRLTRRSGEEVVEKLPPYEGYVPIYQNLLAAMRGEEIRPSAWDCAVDTAIAQAAYASARQSNEVDLRGPDWHVPGDIVAEGSNA